MRIATLAVFACACGSRHAPPVETRVAPKPAPADAGVVTAPPSAPAIVKSAKRARVEAPHGGSIVVLALTADGNAALTADELGGVRLWPALDGTIEPRVVDLGRPQRVAIAREPRGFLVAAIDEVGGLILQVLDRDGLGVQRVSLGIDPAFAGVAAGEHGLVAWRSDHRLLALAADGTVRAELAAPPGQRILAMTVAGDRGAVVLEDAQPKRSVRTFAVADKLAWGAAIAVSGGDVGMPIAISPSGKRFAHLAPQAGKALPLLAVIDSADGTVLASEMIGPNVAFALPDDGHLAIAANGGVQWVDLHAGAKLRANSASERAVLAIGGGRAVTAVSGELVIASSPQKTEYLGYELQSPAVAAAAPQGHMLIGLGDAFALLDGKLDAGPAPDLAVPAGAAIADVRWLAGDDWLVETSRVNDGVTGIALVDVAKHKSVPIRAGMTMVQMLMHEPTTQLVTLSLGDQPEVLRHDPGKLKLDRVAVLPARTTGYERAQIVPVEPKLAGGVQVVVVHMGDHLTVRWVKEPRALDKGTSITLDGALAGVDATGTVYVWQNDVAGALELATLRDGKRTGTLPTDGPTAIWPDPKGTAVVAVGQRSVVMLDADGKRRWSQALQGVTEALWLDDGTLGIVSAAGIARLDAKTGDLVAARCGWRFGLTTKQHPASPRVDPVCAQLR